MKPVRRRRLGIPAGVGIATLALASLASLASGLRPDPARGQERPRLIVLDGAAGSQAVAELVVAAGSAREAPEQAGLASVLAGVLAAEVEAGADVAVLGWAEPDRLAFRILAPPDSLAEVTRRLIGVLVDPEVPEEVLDLERSRIRSALQSRLLSPEVVAARSLTRRLFPGHPYGNLETPATVSRLERRDLMEFHRRNVGPAGALLVAAGVSPSSSVGEELRGALAGWEATGGAAPAGLEPDSGELEDGRPPTAGIPVHIVDVPGAARASIHVGQRLPATTPRQWASLTVAVELAALENDRVFRRWEAFQGDMGPIPSVGGVTRQRLASLLRFQVQVPTPEADRALQTILDNVDRARRTLYAPDRLDAVRERLVEGVDAERGPVERVARLAAYYSVGLGTDPDGAFRDWLVSLDAYDLREAMSGSVHLDSLQVVIAGDATRLVPLMESFGPVTVADARAVTAENGNRPLPLIFGEGGDGSGPGGDGAGPGLDGPPLAPGRWIYRVLVEGRDQGRMTREIVADPEDGTMTVRTVLEAGGLVQDATVRFEPATLGMIEADLRLSGGADELETELRGEAGVIRGRRRSDRAGITTAIEGTLPPGALVGELLELALWRMDLEVGDHVRLPFIDPGTGQGQIADVVVLGTGTAFGPWGDEETLIVEVVTGGLRQRLHLRPDRPHVPIASEIVGQPLRLELIEERPSGSAPR